jgi:hypothetical protein
MKAVQTRVLAYAHDDPTVATVEYDRWLYIEAYDSYALRPVPVPPRTDPIRDLMQGIEAVMMTT